jgi:CheY-like chemotaxis protein
VSAPAEQPLMIVDDDDDLRETLANVLAANGYNVTAFGDARAALVALEDGQTPFVILLDLMMPGMSGWEFRAAQLANPSLASIPVLVVTAANVASHDMPTLPDVEILRKPFDLDRLLTIIERYAAAARVRRQKDPASARSLRND